MLILACDFKVVCDTMLQGLSRQLRSCDIDAIILNKSKPHEHAASVAVSENRVTFNIRFALRFPFLSSACWKLSEHLIRIKTSEQLAYVIEHFIVKVATWDVFSRCQLCNSGQ